MACLVVAPVAAFADSSADHAQAELSNGMAQFEVAQQTAADMQNQANLSAANERTIAVFQSELLRQKQLATASNATAMEQIASALANAARADADVNARNDLAIAQIKAAALVNTADANLANAMAQGRPSEITNAQAQSTFMHQVADFITGTLAEQGIANDKAIAENRADAIHTPALVQEQNGLALGANDVLAADAVLSASALNATSVNLHAAAQSSTLLAHADASLRNAQAMASR